MSGINGDWYEALKGEFKKPYYKTLFNTVNEEYRTRQIFPPANDIFNAFHLTPLKDVKVVILGQDPYHNFNQAHGLIRGTFLEGLTLAIRNSTSTMTYC